jgi:hypothetical protein
MIHRDKKHLCASLGQCPTQQNHPVQVTQWIVNNKTDSRLFRAIYHWLLNLFFQNPAKIRLLEDIPIPEFFYHIPEFLVAVSGEIQKNL